VDTEVGEEEKWNHARKVGGRTSATAGAFEMNISAPRLSKDAEKFGKKWG